MKHALALLFLSSVAFAGEAPTAHRPNPVRLLERAADLSLHVRERNLAAATLLEDRGVAIAVLRDGLADKRSVMRQTAAILLRRLPDVSMEKPLLAAAVGNDPLVGQLAIKALAVLYAEFPEKALLQRLSPLQPLTSSEKTDSPARRWQEAMLHAALLAVDLQAESGRAPSDAIVNRITRIGLRGDAVVRIAAAQALGHAHGDTATSFLLASLELEEDEHVLIALCRAIASARPAEGNDRLLALAQDEARPALALEAAGALHGMAVRGSLDAVALYVDHPDIVLRRRAVTILAHSGDPAALAKIEPALEDAAWIVRLDAVRAFRRFPVGGVPAGLQRRLQDDDPRVRAEAAILLHERHVAGASRALLDDLKNGNLFIRREAARALGEIAEPKASGLLRQALADKDLELACRATAALGRIPGDDNADALRKALNDPRAPVVVAAREALARHENTAK